MTAPNSEIGELHKELTQKAADLAARYGYAFVSSRMQSALLLAAAKVLDPDDIHALLKQAIANLDAAERS